MTLPTRTCSKCAALLGNVRAHREQSVVALDDSGKVNGAQRSFLGECPTHGTMLFTLPMGHHSTYGAKQLNRRYPTAAKGLILSQLNEEDRAAFSKAMRGHRRPNEAELMRWDRLSAGPRVSAFDAATKQLRGEK